MKERSDKKSTAKGLVMKVALGLALGGGVLVALAVAPGLGAALKLIDPNPRIAMDKLERAFRRLVKSGDLEVEQGRKKRYRVTSSGERKLARLQFADYPLPPSPKKWDGKWRVICFDIPETEQYTRKIFQSKLSELGFYHLQNSIFVYPYPCPELITLADRAFGLREYVRLILAESTDQDATLMNFFRLKR